MKKILFLSICCLFTTMTVVKAQRKNSLGISLGANIPVGDFASIEGTNEQSGFAKLGLAADLNYLHEISANFGLIAMLRGRLNGIDEKALASQYSLPTGSGGSKSIETGTYKTGAILVGFYKALPITTSNVFFFEVKALAGLQRTTIPEFNLSITIPGLSSFTQKEEAYHANSFAYLVGGAFRYKLNDQLSLKLNGDYNAAKPNFDVVVNGASRSYKQPTNTVDVTLGLVIGL